jgi:hypothetical protein
MTNNKINTDKPVGVLNGGLGVPSLTAYAPVCGGVTSTGPVQSVASLGSAGEPYVSNGPGVLGSFQAVPSGSITLIQSLTASSSASLIFNTMISSSGVYMFVLQAVVPASQSAIRLLISNNGGSSWVTSGYASGVNYASYNDTGWVNSTSSSFLTTSYLIDSTAGYGVNAVVYVGNIFLPNYCQTFGQSERYVSSTLGFGVMAGNSGITGVNAFKWLFSSGNISSGTISLYYMGA